MISTNILTNVFLFQCLSQKGGPSKPQIPRSERSVLSEIPIEHENVNDFNEEADDENEYPHANLSELKRKRREDTTGYHRFVETHAII